LKKPRKKKSSEEYLAKKLKKFGERWAANRKKRGEERRAFLAKVKDNPEWFRYPELDYWIERKHLLNDTIRKNIHVILHNPTYSKQQKVNAIDYLIKLEAIALHVDPKLGPDELPRVARRTTLDTTSDPDLNPKVPKTFHELIAQAEMVILPEEIPRRYAPPEQKPKYLKNEY